MADWKRGRCPVCGYSMALRKNGGVQNHLLYGVGFGGQPVHCMGGGRAPLDDGADPVWESPRANQAQVASSGGTENT